jgi:hypothetical protein
MSNRITLTCPIRNRPLRRLLRLRWCKSFLRPSPPGLGVLARGKGPTWANTGLVAAGMASLGAGQRRLKTPHLAIRYKAPRASLFWRT